MAIILNIDTAVETASVCLAKDGMPLQAGTNKDMRDHASWLHPVIKNIVGEAGLKISDLRAIAVSIGPGSYTGLRVGLSAAKGLCFALNIPLIAVNTLEMMAFATRNEEAELFCPMIDARRMEVFTAAYDKELKEVAKPSAMIINGNSFDSFLASGKVMFSGNGSRKLKEVISHSNASYSDTIATAADMVILSENYFNEEKFSDLAYAEPFYLKEFYSAAR